MEKTIIETSDRRFALLIDADNVSARYLKPILNELSKYGTVTIKRIYGDWTLTLHAKWKDALLENSITPIQQFGYTQGKNATDSAMIIDAMDILYTDNVDGFCLVSSDSDFTRLASRLRESGRMVIGMGEKKTPTPFRRACDVFTTLELLVQKKNERGGSGNAVPKDSVEQAVVDIITDNQNNGKATGLGEIGSRLQKRYPDFDVRSYGTNLLSKLLEEFTRVRITKDHSSVTVELAEGVEERGSEKPESDAGSRAEKSGRGGRGKRTEKVEGGDKAEKPSQSEELEKADRTEGETSDAAVDAERDGGETAEKSEKPGRRSRSHRGTRRVATKAAGQLAEGPKAAAALPGAAEPTAEAVAEPARETEGASAAASAEEAPRDVKPGRRARAERQAKATKSTTAKKPAAEEAPSKKPATKEAPVKKASAKRKPAKKAASADTPAGYIRQLVADAGAEGVMLSTITDAVRAKFKDFKVRDLGYSQMRQYMASVGDYNLEKSGRNFRVRLAK